MIQFPLPLLGFCAYSGTGKTTLLKQILPVLGSRRLRVGVVKHAHHQFDIDHPQKDSYVLRKAGTTQMLIASRRRMALITEFEDDQEEPTLERTLNTLDTSLLDLVLVEGFKRESFPKIELHRPSLGNPLLCATDPDIVALATNAPVDSSPDYIPVLNLNDIGEISDFILRHIQKSKENRTDERSAHSNRAQLY